MTFRIIQAFLLSLAASAVSSVGLPRSPVTNAGPHSRLWSESSLIDDEGFLTNAFGGIPGDWESLTTLPLEAEAANSDANSDAARSSIDTYPKLVELIPHSQFSIPNNSTTSIRGAFRSKPMNFTNYYNPFSKTYPYSTLGSAPSEKEMKNSPSSPKPLPSNAIYPNKRICLILPNPPTTLKRNPLSLLSDAEGRPPQSLGGLYDSSKMGWTKSGDIGYFQVCVCVCLCACIVSQRSRRGLHRSYVLLFGINTVIGIEMEKEKENKTLPKTCAEGFILNISFHLASSPHSLHSTYTSSIRVSTTFIATSTGTPFSGKNRIYESGERVILTAEVD